MFEYNYTNIKYSPNQAGVYLICTKRLSDGRYTVVYVGQSEDLNRRLQEHLSDAEPNGLLKQHINKYVCYYQYELVSRQVDRDALERQYYSTYTPICNQKRP